MAFCFVCAVRGGVIDGLGGVGVVSFVGTGRWEMGVFCVGLVVMWDILYGCESLINRAVVGVGLWL